MNRRPHERLDVWQKSIELVEMIYKITKRFPKEEVYGLVTQMRRAAISVSCNIAEGAARHTKSEFRQFLFMSRGSLSELETELFISFRLGYILPEKYKEILELTNKIGSMLTALIKSIK